MLQLYVGQERCGWLDPSGQPRWEAGGGFGDCIRRCAEAAAKATPGRWLRRQTVQVWISGGLARPFVLGPMAGLKGAAEAESFAKSQVAEATGWDVPCDVRLEGDVTKGPALAIAMTTTSRETIEGIIKESGLRLKSLRPWWAGALAQTRAAEADLQMLVVEEPDSLVLLTGSGDVWSLAEGLAPKPQEEDAIRTVRRLGASAGVAASTTAWVRLDEAGSSSVSLWPSAKLHRLEEVR